MVRPPTRPLAASDHQQSMVVAISRLEEPKVLAGELAEFLHLPVPSSEGLPAAAAVTAREIRAADLAPATVVLPHSWSA